MKTDHDDDMLPEYDFAGKAGVRGKYYQRLRQGYTIKIRQSDSTILVRQIMRRETCERTPGTLSP